MDALLRVVSRSMLSLLGFACGMCVFWAWKSDLVDESMQNIDAIFIASGSTIGAVIALILSLSILPIQRAIEITTYTVSELYRKDKATHFTILLLTFAAIISFLFTVDGLFLFDDIILLSIEIFIIGISLDIVRWHYARICQLLVPNRAISMLHDFAVAEIDKIDKLTHRNIKTGYRRLPKAKRNNESKDTIAKRCQAAASVHYRKIAEFSAELAEMASRAVARGETGNALMAINQIGSVGTNLIDFRRKSVLLWVSWETLLPIVRTDIEKILYPVYESLCEINRKASERGEQAVCNGVIECLKRLSIALSTLDECERIPFVFIMPLQYVQECGDQCHQHQMEDGVLRAIYVIMEVASFVASNKACRDQDLLLILDSWQHLSLLLFSYRGGVFMNEPYKLLMGFLWRYLSRCETHSTIVLARSLKHIMNILSVGYSKGMLHNTQTPDFPLSYPYDITKEDSLWGLVVVVARRVRRNGEDQRNPYSELQDVTNEIWQHFYSVVTRLDLGMSHLLWHIIHTVKRIAEILIDVTRINCNDCSEDIGKTFGDAAFMSRILSDSFQKSSAIKYYYAEEACDAIAGIGLRSALLHTTKSWPIFKTSLANPSSCISHLKYVVSVYLKSGDDLGDFKIAGLLEYVDYFDALATEEPRFKRLRTQVAKVYVDIADESGGRWAGFENALLIRIGQYEERHQNRLSPFDVDRAIGQLSNAIQYARKRHEYLELTRALDLILASKMNRDKTCLKN